MNKEEINYWLKEFRDNKYAYMSKDGEIISFYKLFEQVSKLQQENQKYKEVIDKAIKELNDYLNINTVIRDDLLDILKEVK
ncbi:MAG: hypothetical protein ACI31S_01980 [Bacilli bacterium]